MDQQNQLPTPTDRDPAAPEGAAAATSAAGINRRTLLRGGAAASPILLTLASGPVAATGTCVVASSFVSATVYQSRNPGSTNIACVPKTCQSHCDDAKNTSWSGCSSVIPLNCPVSNFITGSISCVSGSYTFTHASMCYHVFKNHTSGWAWTGTGMQSTGDIAVLQRLLALGHGASGTFTPAYCRQIWDARSTPSLLAALVNDGSNDWDTARLMQWLDYSANGVTF
jgi:hypothetical protein